LRAEFLWERRYSSDVSEKIAAFPFLRTAAIHRDLVFLSRMSVPVG